ncbi:hypothetical protein ACHAWF_015725 [Thalassiosira exigua]
MRFTKSARNVPSSITTSIFFGNVTPQPATFESNHDIMTASPHSPPLEYNTTPRRPWAFAPRPPRRAKDPPPGPRPRLAARRSRAFPSRPVGAGQRRHKPSADEVPLAPRRPQRRTERRRP